MACNCKHNKQEIQNSLQNFSQLRNLFIKRMTIDSDHNDARRKDFNQAIFHFEEDRDVDLWNKDCAIYGLPKKSYGRTYPVWSEMDMDMVLRCFDAALQDWRKSLCDSESCTEK